MTSLKRAAIFTLAAVIALAPVFAHAAPPPPPPPPSPGAGVIIDRHPDRTFHVDVRCAEGDTTRACAEIATQLFDKVNGAAAEK